MATLTASAPVRTTTPTAAIAAFAAPASTSDALVLTTLDGSLRHTQLGGRPVTCGSDGVALFESVARGDDGTAFCIAWTFCWVAPGAETDARHTSSAR